MFFPVLSKLFQNQRPGVRQAERQGPILHRGSYPRTAELSASMRTCWLLFSWLLPLQIASAQTFFATPGPLKTQELAPEQANEVYIFFENSTADTLRLRWKKVEASYPAAWNVDLCDFGTCYVGIPAGGLMNPASAQQQPYLKLIVQPGTAPGAAWLWFRVWEDGNPTNYEDVFFNLNTSGTTAVPELQSGDLRAFPNPSRGGLLVLENNSGQPTDAALSDVSGQIRWTGVLPPGKTNIPASSTWIPGLYILKTRWKTCTVIILN